MVKIDHGGDEKVQRLQVFHRKWDIFNSMLTYLLFINKGNQLWPFYTLTN